MAARQPRRPSPDRPQPHPLLHRARGHPPPLSNARWFASPHEARFSAAHGFFVSCTACSSCVGCRVHTIRSAARVDLGAQCCARSRRSTAVGGGLCVCDHLSASGLDDVRAGTTSSTSPEAPGRRYVPGSCGNAPDWDRDREFGRAQRLPRCRAAANGAAALPMPDSRLVPHRSCISPKRVGSRLGSTRGTTIREVHHGMPRVARLRPATARRLPCGLAASSSALKLAMRAGATDRRAYGQEQGHVNRDITNPCAHLALAQSSDNTSHVPIGIDADVMPFTHERSVRNGCDASASHCGCALRPRRATGAFLWAHRVAQHRRAPSSRR